MALPDTGQTGDIHAGDEASSRILRKGDTCWRVERANRFALIVDAASYFAAARKAMLEAEHSIVLVGWDFDLRIDLDPEDNEGDIPTTLGDFLKSIVERKPHLRIFILKWDMAVLYTLTDQMLPVFALDLIRWKRIHLRFDSTHPWTAAHHQKVVVIDNALAFCGGIDMTTDRWDTRGHLPDDPRRVRPDGSHYPPWHDATTVVDGAAARALGDLARDRWAAATGKQLDIPKSSADLWPDHIEPHFRDIEVGIARTMPAYGKRQAVHEIEALYLSAIASARQSIYLESQYFASAKICEAIAARLREPDGPEVVVINPLTAEGWLEEETMGSARDLKLQAIRKLGPTVRFGIYHPVNAVGTPIYVHAKILVIDDRFIRVGSSNVNNRSMGFDTECDLAIEASTDEQRATIRAMRDDLLAEHLAVDVADLRAAIDRDGSMLSAINRLRRGDGRTLQPIPVHEVNDAEALLAESHAADPERPGAPEGRIAHIAKRLALRIAPPAWLAVSAGGLAGLFLAARARRNARAPGKT